MVNDDRTGFGSLLLNVGKLGQEESLLPDVIIYDEVVPWVSNNLVENLKVGGKLIAPVANSDGVGNMLLIEKVSEDRVCVRDLTGTVEEPLETKANQQIDQEDDDIVGEELFARMMASGPYSQKNPDLDASYMFMMDQLAPRDRKRDRFKKYLMDTFGTDDTDKLLEE